MNGIFHLKQFFISFPRKTEKVLKRRKSWNPLPWSTATAGQKTREADGGKRCLFPREIRTFAKIIFVSFRRNGKNTFRGEPYELLWLLHKYFTVAVPVAVLAAFSNAPGIYNKRMIVYSHLFISTLLNQSLMNLSISLYDLKSGQIDLNRVDQVSPYRLIDFNLQLASQIIVASSILFRRHTFIFAFWWQIQSSWNRATV